MVYKIGAGPRDSIIYNILVNFRILFNLVLGGFRDFKDEAFKEGLGCPVPASKFRKLRIRSQTYPN